MYRNLKKHVKTKYRPVEEIKDQENGYMTNIMPFVQPVIQTVASLTQTPADYPRNEPDEEPDINDELYIERLFLDPKKEKILIKAVQTVARNNKISSVYYENYMHYSNHTKLINFINKYKLPLSEIKNIMDKYDSAPIQRGEPPPTNKLREEKEEKDDKQLYNDTQKEFIDIFNLNYDNMGYFIILSIINLYNKQKKVKIPYNYFDNKNRIEFAAEFVAKNKLNVGDIVRQYNAYNAFEHEEKEEKKEEIKTNNNMFNEKKEEIKTNNDIYLTDEKSYSEFINNFTKIIDRSKRFEKVIINAHAERIADYINRNKKNNMTDLYPTPQYCLKDLINNYAVGHNVLEPTAGLGSVLYFLLTNYKDRVKNITAVEFMPTYANFLKYHYKNVDIREGDFLTMNFIGHKYDTIICNPPFSLRGYKNDKNTKDNRFYYNFLFRCLELLAISDNSNKDVHLTFICPPLFENDKEIQFNYKNLLHLSEPKKQEILKNSMFKVNDFDLYFNILFSQIFYQYSNLGKCDFETTKFNVNFYGFTKFRASYGTTYTDEQLTPEYIINSYEPYSDEDEPIIIPTNKPIEKKIEDSEKRIDDLIWARRMRIRKTRSDEIKKERKMTEKQQLKKEEDDARNKKEKKEKKVKPNKEKKVKEEPKKERKLTEKQEQPIIIPNKNILDSLYQNFSLKNRKERDTMRTVLSKLTDTTEILDIVYSENVGDLYPTPQKCLTDYINNNDIYGKTILEPSAGLGSIIYNMLNRDLNEDPIKKITAYELDIPMSKFLIKQYPTVDVKRANFLTTPTINNNFDLIICNPPFTHYYQDSKGKSKYDKSYFINFYFKCCDYMYKSVNPEREKILYFICPLNLFDEFFGSKKYIHELDKDGGYTTRQFFPAELEKINNMTKERIDQIKEQSDIYKEFENFEEYYDAIMPSQSELLPYNCKFQTTSTKVFFYKFIFY